MNAPATSYEKRIDNYERLKRAKSRRDSGAEKQPLVCNLRAIRQSHGISDDTLARAVGLTTQILIYIERGGDVTMRRAREIALFFDCQVSDIWPLEENPA